MNDQPTNKSILEGTLAQAFGGAVGVFVSTTLASFKIYMQAGWETAFGTICSVVLYVAFKTLRKR